MSFIYAKQNNIIAGKLQKIMLKKKTNLAFSVDVTDTRSLLDLVEKTAEHIAILKIHTDIISDFNIQFTRELRKMADELDFLIFEDRKFIDIGNTVYYQVSGGIYHIAHWVDIINACLISGISTINGLRKGCEKHNIGLLLLAQMSSNDNHLGEKHKKNIVSIAEENKDFVIGFIAQRKLSENNNLITMTPGVHFCSKEDHLGQRYNTPESAISQNKSDIIIVGRGIYKSENPRKSAMLYKQKSWDLFLSNH